MTSQIVTGASVHERAARRQDPVPEQHGREVPHQTAAAAAAAARQRSPLLQRYVDVTTARVFIPKA